MLVWLAYELEGAQAFDTVFPGMGHDQTQDFLDNLTKAFERGGGSMPRGGFGAPR